MESKSHSAFAKSEESEEVSLSVPSALRDGTRLQGEVNGSIGTQLLLNGFARKHLGQLSVSV